MNRNMLMTLAVVATLGVAPGLALDGPMPSMPSRPRRKPGAPHAGTRETMRRQRQEAARAAKREGLGG